MPQVNHPSAFDAAPGPGVIRAAEMPTPPLTRGERLGRRLGIALFALVVVFFTITCATEIIVQVWFSPRSEENVSCRPSIVKLIHAVRRARGVAAAEVGGERAAVSQFRGALDPEWAQRDALDQACSGDPAALRALREVDQYRYAEEHSARIEALDLARRRRQMHALEQHLSGENR